jgi:hypothetical protein
VSYLSRVAARAAGPASVAQMPATLGSSSPLVAHDQRLNIPEFAAAPPVIGATAAPPEGGVGAPALAEAATARSRIEQEVIVTGAPAARAVEVASTTPAAAAAGPIALSRTQPTDPRSSWVARFDAPAPPADAAQQPERARRSHYVEGRRDSLETAFAEANAWLRSPPSERRAKQRMEATKPNNPVAGRDPSDFGAAPMIRYPDRPSLTIGTINVEVVPERPLVPGAAPKTPPRREPMPRGRSAGMPFGARAAFGWRQR